MSDLEQFLSELSRSIELVTPYEARLARIQAPRFNTFDYIDPDENRVTAILADLLDPNGRHGQGPVFLKEFLTFIRFDVPESSIRNAVVATEIRTEWDRRLDLMIRMDDWTLALENKIGAGEQPHQLADYVTFLHREKRWILIFLTPDGRDPQTCGDWSTWRQRSQARSLSYLGLSSWLRSCLSASGSDRVRMLLQDMAEWAKDIGGNMADRQILTTQLARDLILRDHRYMKALLPVLDASDAIKKHLIVDFYMQLKEELARSYPYPMWNMSAQEDLSAKYPGLFIQGHSWPSDIWAGIEAERITQDFYYGVACKRADPAAQEKLRVSIERRAKGNSSDGWAWWKWVPDFRGVRMRHWYSGETIMAMAEKRSEMVSNLISLISDTEEVVSSFLVAPGT